MTVRIVEPVGIDLAAYEFIKGSGQAGQWFWHIDESTIRLWEDLTTIYGGSRYADYATLNLGERYVFRKEYNKAIEFLQKVST